MTAFQHDRPAAEPEQVASGQPSIGHVLPQRPAQQHLGLGEIWCEHHSEGDEQLCERGDRVVLEQLRAALGHHDRIDHQWLQRPLRQLPRHQLDDRGAGQHAGLDGGRPQVFRHRHQLASNQVKPDLLVAGHAFGVLGGDSRDDAGAMQTEGCEGLEVGLDAGAAA